MADEKHIYLTVSGGYIPAYVPMGDETWQFGVRLPLVFGGIDPIGSLPNNWNPYADPQSHTEAQWTTTSNWSVEGPGTVTWNPCDYLTDNAMPAAKALISASSGVFSTAVQLRELRVYPIGSNGLAVPAPPYAAGTPAVGTFTTLPAGGGSGLTAPQVSAAISLRTNQIGRRGRGRCFGPPAPAASTGTGNNGGIMTDTFRDGLLAAWKTFMEDIAVTGSGVGQPSLAPAVIGAPWNSYATVTRIVMDPVWDTQRRRRRSVRGTPASTTLDIG